MKKSLVALAFLFTAVFNAQVKFGAKAGYLNSNLVLSHDSETNMKYIYGNKSSFYGGLLVEYPINPTFSLQGEVLYADLGSKIKRGSEEVEMAASTLLVPIGFNYYANPQLSLGAGMNIGYIFDFKMKSKGEEIENPYTENFKKTALAPYIGLAYNLKQGLFFDTRYNFGVSNLYDGSENQSKMIMKNNFFQIGLGYKF